MKNQKFDFFCATLSIHRRKKHVDDNDDDSDHHESNLT